RGARGMATCPACLLWARPAGSGSRVKANKLPPQSAPATRRRMCEKISSMTAAHRRAAPSPNGCSPKRVTNPWRFSAPGSAAVQGVSPWSRRHTADRSAGAPLHGSGEYLQKGLVVPRFGAIAERCVEDLRPAVFPRPRHGLVDTLVLCGCQHLDVSLR